jgi:hypothetical protein
MSVSETFMRFRAAATAGLISRELPETPELLERRERERAADRERLRRKREEERELPEASKT